jgi:hypothetical protein
LVAAAGEFYGAATGKLDTGNTIADTATASTTLTGAAALVGGESTKAAASLSNLESMA